MLSSVQTQDCEFYLVGYAPNPLDCRMLNVGLLLHCRETGFMGCRFIEDTARIRSFHAQADLEFLAQLQEYFERQIEDHRDDLTSLLQEVRTYSNIVQVGPPQKCATCDPRAEIRKLFERYVG